MTYHPRLTMDATAAIRLYRREKKRSATRNKPKLEAARREMDALADRVLREIKEAGKGGRPRKATSARTPSGKKRKPCPTCQGPKSGSGTHCVRCLPFAPCGCGCGELRGEKREGVFRWECHVARVKANRKQASEARQAHGSRSRYRAGCRCYRCTMSEQAYHAARPERQSRKARAVDAIQPVTALRPARHSTVPGPSRQAVA